MVGTVVEVGVPRRTKFDFWLDIVLLVAMTLDYSFRFTGLAIHEWIGVAFVVLLPVHLTQHWDWTVRTTRRLWSRRRSSNREALRWLVDLLLLPSLVLCVASGLLVSRSALPAIGLRPGSDGFWNGLHSTSADASLFLVAFHVALNWRWVLSITRRLTGRSATRSAREHADRVADRVAT